MGDDDTTDDDNFSGFSAPSLSAKNMTSNPPKPRVSSQMHGRFEMNNNFRDLQINVTNSNFDMKEEQHSLYLSDTITVIKPRNSGGRDEDDDSSVGDFVIEKKNPSPARPGKEGKSGSGSGVMSITSALSSPANSNRRSIKKSVTFSADTVTPREDHIALSITKHLYTRELGYTQYHIQLMYRGREWTVFKRYRDFSTFHVKLLAENANYQIGLPDLPKKRWFEKQRWLNKFDESYSLHRKNALQDYLRLLAKTPIVKNRFQCFADFLDIPLEKSKEHSDDFDAESEHINFDLALNQHSKYPQEGNHYIHDININGETNVGNQSRQTPQRKQMPDFDDILLPEDNTRVNGGGVDRGRVRGGSSESTSDYYDEEPDGEGFCYNEPPPAQPYSSNMIYGHNGTSAPPQIPSSGHYSPHPLHQQKHVRQHHSPPPSRPTHQTAHSHHNNHHNKNYHHNNNNNHHHQSHSRPDFRDSILETPLNQQFDDDGEMIVSRP